MAFRLGFGFNKGGEKGFWLPTPPLGYGYVVDSLGVFLQSSDGKYLTVLFPELAETPINIAYLVDDNGNFLQHDNGSLFQVTTPL